MVLILFPDTHNNRSATVKDDLEQLHSHNKDSSVDLLAYKVWKFELIDSMFDAQETLDYIASLSPERKHAHVWTTMTLDVLYPFAYSSLFLGMAIKAFPSSIGTWLAIPSIVCVPVDLLEGYSQVMLLNGNDEYINLKVMATKCKFILFITGLLISIISVFRLLLARENRAEKRD